MIERKKFYINGNWVAPIIERDFNVINPSTGETCAVISLGSTEDTNAAVAAAKAAFPAWSNTDVEERAKLLDRAYELYISRKTKIAEAMMLEMGAPRTLAEGAQWGAGAVHFEEAIRALRQFEFKKRTSSDTLFFEAIGVAALITPWNWPMNQVILKLVPALAAGCTVILKPSEIAPLSSLLLVETFEEAGFPPGVLNLVNGDGAGVGSQLSIHPDVDMVSFTGSTRAGALISKAAADSVKRVSLELGGKGANIIFEDADVGAVKRGVWSCFRNSGQSCNAPTRMLVERSIYNKAVIEAVSFANGLKIGHADVKDIQVGPVVSEQHLNKIKNYIQIGIDEGAELVAGGVGTPEGLDSGFYVKPTIFANVKNNMCIAQEEIFGPVLVMIPFDDEVEALEIANDTPYGLCNYVQTGDAAQASRIAKGLRSGMVEVNGVSLGIDTPFGGYKQSGAGREGSVWGIEDYLEIKVVAGIS